jgi:hypothetical protein
VLRNLTVLSVIMLNVAMLLCRVNGTSVIMLAGIILIVIKQSDAMLNVNVLTVNYTLRHCGAILLTVVMLSIVILIDILFR